MTVSLLAPLRPLALASVVLLAGCVTATPPEPPKAINAFSQPSQPVVDTKRLSVEARHSETARVGDLSGLMVMVDNAGDTAVDAIRIDVSAAYLAGFTVRRVEPAAIDTRTATDGQSFYFKGPAANSKASYLLTLAPTTVGEYPAEIVVSVKDSSSEKLVAILDVRTVVAPPKVLQ